MRKPYLVIGMLLVGATLGRGDTFGQDYPNKPIRIVTNLAGGGDDTSARIIGQGISGPLEQPVIIENRPANLIGEIVTKAAPDGYTVMLTGPSFMFAPLLRPMPYDTVRDFSPITSTTMSANVLIVHPSLPVESVKDLIALAKARPGELNYGMNGLGGSQHLATELFKSKAGVNIVGVVYKGAAAGLNGVMGGEVQMAFGNVVSVRPYVKAGKLRALAVTGRKPSVLFPGLPTVAASGLPGYEFAGTDGMWAPARTPAAVINRLNREIVRFLDTTETRQKYLTLGVEVVVGSPEEHAATIKAAVDSMAKVIKDANIKID